jgi:hypothetical protein
LTKEEIRSLHGGRFRGEKLILALELETPAPVYLVGKLRNQFQSQVTPSHPEGSGPILIDGFKPELRYDLATETITWPVPVMSGGTIVFQWGRFPVKMYRPDPRRVDMLLLQRESRVWAARRRLLRTIAEHWSDAPVCAVLIAERLGIQQTGEPLAARMICYVYALDDETCNSLTELLMTPAIALRVAA